MGLENRTHGHCVKGYSTPTYISWTEMKRRCRATDRKEWTRWGGRGIKVCGRWLHSFPLFLKDKGIRPVGKTLDRIDPNGDYTPDNTRWATPKEQAQTRRPKCPSTI